MKSLDFGSTIGILGGGQLGRMLCSSAARLGYRTLVLDPNSTSPAFQLSNDHLVAPYDDESALSIMAERCDIITYEFENVPLSAASFLQSRVSLSPPSEALRVSQDRLIEKEFLSDLGFTLSPFSGVESLEDLQTAYSSFGKGILKSTRFGYDGKGQYTIDSSPTDSSIDFSIPYVFEQFQDFDYEFSIIAARSHDRQIVFYATARNVHKDGILHSSTVPSGVPESLERSSQSLVKKLLDSLDYVGVLGVEFFCTSGESIVNEIAPRVHNSGHWTELCHTSQFEQHIRAICGLPLGSPVCDCDCEMINLIGDDIYNLDTYLSDKNVFLNLYGKDDVRSGRKMGHIIRRI